MRAAATTVAAVVGMRVGVAVGASTVVDDRRPQPAEAPAPPPTLPVGGAFLFSRMHVRGCVSVDPQWTVVDTGPARCALCGPVHAELSFCSRDDTSTTDPAGHG